MNTHGRPISLAINVPPRKSKYYRTIKIKITPPPAKLSSTAHSHSHVGTPLLVQVDIIIVFFTHPPPLLYHPMDFVIPNIIIIGQFVPPVISKSQTRECHALHIIFTETVSFRTILDIFTKEVSHFGQILDIFTEKVSFRTYCFIFKTRSVNFGQILHSP